jgi:CRISPR-associated protein Csd1
VSGRCLVTGDDGMVETILPGKIKRLQGASRTGAALVSAKHASTHHYGLDGALNAPISRGAAEKYTAALNTLLQDDNRHVFTGDYKTGKGITYVFWSQRPESGGELLANLIADPKPEHVRALIRAPKSGAGIPPALETDAFYTLALSGNAGRVQIRDYTETTVADLKANVTFWFEAQEISDPWGEPADPLKIFALVASCYADTKDVQPHSVAALWKTALHGTRPPTDLLTCAVRRNRVEVDRGNVTRSRAALIKLLFTYEQEGGETMEQTPAYNCGRLLAELQAVQEAVRGRGNTNVERQYGTASTSPASMFGLLIRNSQAHMATIRRDKPHIAPILEARMEEIMSHFEDGFPNTLRLKEQAVFSIGYYQHRAAIRAEIQSRMESRRNKQHTEEVS